MRLPKRSEPCPGALTGFLFGLLPIDSAGISSKQKYFLLFGTLAIATFFRFYGLTFTPAGLYLDEAMDGVSAQDVSRTGQYRVYYPEDNGREGLYVNILAAAFRYRILPETKPWSVRAPAAAAGVLTVLGTYVLADELWGPEVGLLASFFLATAFWHINFSRIGFRAVLGPLLLTWSCWCFIKCARESRVPRAVIYGIIGGVIYGLGFYTYIAYRITPLLLLALLPFFRKSSGLLRNALPGIFAALLVVLPLASYYLEHPADFSGRSSQVSVLNSNRPVADLTANAVKTALMFNWRGDANWRHNVSGEPELSWPINILFLAGIAVCLFRMAMKWRNSTISNATIRALPTLPIIFTCAWFVLGAIPEIFSNEGIPHALRALLMVVPTMIFAAIGGIWAYRLVRDRWKVAPARFLGFFFLVDVIVTAYVSYFIVWARNPSVPPGFFRELRNHRRSDQCVVARDTQIRRGVAGRSNCLRNSHVGRTRNVCDELVRSEYDGTAKCK